MRRALKYFIIGLLLGCFAFFLALPALVYRESPLVFYPNVINSHLRVQQDLRQLTHYFDADGAKIPILTYRHFVDENNDGEPIEDGITLTNFEKQMETLANMGCHFVTSSELAEAIEKGTPLPKLSVMITFDDCSAEIYEKAYPILKKYEINATVNLIGYYIEHHENYDIPLLTWKMIHEMDSSGLIDFQSQTYYTYSTLMNLNGNEILLFTNHKDNENDKDYLTRISKDLIRNNLKIFSITQSLPVALSYPYGLSNTTTSQAMKNANLLLGFDSGNNRRVDLNNVDAYHLPRYEIIYTFEKMKDFVSYINTDN